MSPNHSPLLLADEQVREFIVNGYLVVRPRLPEGFHDSVTQKLRWVVEEESNPGNNILPWVPEMQEVIDSPELKGALVSLLGERYLVHPHRFLHCRPPADESGKIDLAANCHQDSHTPLGRPRHHYIRYIQVFYFPHDVPIEFGPTHVIPGSQFNRDLTDEDKQRPIPLGIKAGTVCLTHYDVGHAAGINLLDQHRCMVCFVFVRSEEPAAPTWNCKNALWQKPENIQSPCDLDPAWSHIWDWLCGKGDRYESCRNGGATAEAVPSLIQSLNKGDPSSRVNAIYELGAIGAHAVEPLIRELREAGKEDWTEEAILMDDAAHSLAAVGETSVAALTDMLQDESEWVRINAAFALGEMDSKAQEAVPSLVRCLDDDSHHVVRTAIDSLAYIGLTDDIVFSALRRLLVEERKEWKEVLAREWTIQDQVRINAVMALVRTGLDAPGAEEVFLEALHDPCGYVSAYALEGLRRIGTESAIQAVLDFLQARQWDPGITKNKLW